MTYYNTRFIKVRLSVIFLSCVALILLSVAIFLPKPSFAQASRCADPIEAWYECWQKLSTFRNQVNQWCAFADPSNTSGGSKRQACELTLYGSLDYTPTGIATTDKCKTAESALKTPDACYVELKSGAWKTALNNFSDTCTFADPTPECSEQQREQFAEDNNWAVDSSASSSSSSGAVDTTNSAQRSKFIERISTYIRWLTVGVGILSVFGLVISGIQYAAAQENPQSVAAAKSRINNIVIGILIYLTMFGLLQWLIPGGVFGL